MCIAEIECDTKHEECLQKPIDSSLTRCTALSSPDRDAEMEKSTPIPTTMMHASRSSNDDRDRQTAGHETWRMIRQQFSPMIFIEHFEDATY